MKTDKEQINMGTPWGTETRGKTKNKQNKQKQQQQQQ